MIDSHRALLFGGKQENARVADIYIFDFKTKVRDGCSALQRLCNTLTNQQKKISQHEFGV